MRRLTLLVVAAVPCAGIGWPPYTPRIAGALIDHVGIAAASGAFAQRDRAGWTQILAGIQTGDPAWLDLIPRLKQTGDAAALESLPMALSLALQRRPNEVLKRLPDLYPVARICADNEIEPSRGQLRRFLAKTLTAVRAATGPGRDACLARLVAQARRAR